MRLASVDAPRVKREEEQAMKQSYSGGCQCGKVRYEVALDDSLKIKKVDGRKF